MRLTYLFHSGFLLETDKLCLVFDMMMDGYPETFELEVSRDHVSQSALTGVNQSIEQSLQGKIAEFTDLAEVEVSEQDTTSEQSDEQSATNTQGKHGNLAGQGNLVSQENLINQENQVKLDAQSLKQRGSLRGVYPRVDSQSLTELPLHLRDDSQWLLPCHSSQAGVVACKLEQAFAQNKPCYFLSSHFHQDHFQPFILEIFKHYQALAESQGKAQLVHLILSKDIARYRKVWIKELQDKIEWIRKGETLEFPDLSIEAFGSTDVGVSFVCKVENKVIFHAGDLNNWHWTDCSTPQEVLHANQKYQQELQKIYQSHTSFYLAMFPCDPRIGSGFLQGAQEFVSTFNVGCFVPMHFWEKLDQLNTELPNLTKEGIELVKTSLGSTDVKAFPSAIASLPVQTPALTSAKAVVEPTSVVTPTLDVTSKATSDATLSLPTLVSETLSVTPAAQAIASAFAATVGLSTASNEHTLALTNTLAAKDQDKDTSLPAITNATITNAAITNVVITNTAITKDTSTTQVQGACGINHNAAQNVCSEQNVCSDPQSNLKSAYTCSRQKVWVPHYSGEHLYF